MSCEWKYFLAGFQKTPDHAALSRTHPTDGGIEKEERAKQSCSQILFLFTLVDSWREKIDPKPQAEQ